MRNAICRTILLLCLTGICSSNDELGRIIFANVLFRHGDRTPVDPYPNDPYKNESLWPVPFGHLTNTGKHQHLVLGRWLRNRYAQILPQTYSYYDIYVLSTDVDRTLMSAEANLAGLYPPVGNELWDIKTWMPIPVHTIPKKEDSVLAGAKFCEKYNYEMMQVMNSPEMQALNAKYGPLYNYLSEKTGKKIDDLSDLEFIYNTLFIEELYNKTLPEWTRAVYPHKLEPLAAQSFTLATYNTILKRFKSGPLLKNMIHNMKNKAKNSLKPDRKLWIYSAHDETVANFLNTLNVFEPHCPPYAATVLLELRVNAQNEHVVTIFYKNSTQEPILLTLPGCKAACPLGQFIYLTKSVVPDDWERECLMGFENFQFTANPNAYIAILSSSLLVIMMLLILVIAYFSWHYKKGRQQYYTRLSMDA